MSKYNSDFDSDKRNTHNQNKRNHNSGLEKNGLEKNMNETDDFEREAAQFDQQLERLLKNGTRWPQANQTHSEMLHLAEQLQQEAPNPIRPDSTFRAHLEADLRRRALAQTTAAAAASRPRKAPLLGWGWRMSGGLALTTVVLLTTILALNLTGRSQSSSPAATPVNQAFLPTQSLSPAPPTAVLATPLAVTAAAPVVSTAATALADPIATKALATFGQLPTNDYLPASESASGKPFSIVPHVKTVASASSTPVLTSFVRTSQPNNASPLLSSAPTDPTLSTDAPPTLTASPAANSLLTYTLKTTLPTLPTTGQVFRQVQPQLNEARLRALGQHFGLDATANFNLQPPANANSAAKYSLSENDQTLAISSNGHLTYTEPKLPATSTVLLSDAAASSAAIAYLSKLGLSLTNKQWGTLQVSVEPIAAGDNSGLRFVSFGPAKFVVDSSGSNYPVSEAITLQITLNASSQVTFLDSSLPLLVDEQGGLSFATMEATSYPLINAEQLKAALDSGQVNLTQAMTSKLQQMNLSAQGPLTVNLSEATPAYMPTYNSAGRLHLLPVVLVRGTFDPGSGPIAFEGYVIQVQSQYLQP